MTFYYSGINHAMTSQWPSDSINLLWNQQLQKNRTKSMLFMTPSINTACYEFPEFVTWGNNLLNPMLAIQQTIQSFNNGNWMNWGGNNGGFNWGNMWNNPWGNFNPWRNNGGNSSTSSDNLEYDALKALINKYKDMYGETQAIKDALGKTGTSDEKLLALKEAYKTLNSKKLEKALLELPEYKEALENSGYKFSKSKKNDSDETTTIRENLSKISAELAAGNWNLLNSTYGAEAKQDEIIQVISIWNDSHTQDGNRSILRMCANNIHSDDATKEVQRQVVRNLASHLTSKAAELESEIDSDCEKLREAMQNLEKAVAGLGKDKADYDKFTKDNVNAVADKFETLYAIVRLMQAEMVRNEAKSKYSFLNNISSTDKDFVDDNLIVKETRKDLEAEGINLDGVETDNIPEEEVETPSHDIDGECETPEEKLEALVDAAVLEKSANENVFKTKTTSNNAEKHFYMANGENLVELKDVKAIDKDGNCTMLDGSTKKLADVEKINITAEDIQNYNKAFAEVDKLIKDGKIAKYSDLSAAKSKGITVYTSKHNNADGKKEYYMIKDNELVKINGTVSNDGNVKFADGSSKHLSVLTSDDVTELDGSYEFPSAENVEAKKHNEAKKASEKLLDETYSCQVADNGIYTLPSKDVTMEINNKGEIVLAAECKLKSIVTTEEGKRTIKIVKLPKGTVITKDMLDAHIAALSSSENWSTGNKKTLGKQFAEDLMGRTNGEEETRAAGILFDYVNVYNIKDFIEDYTEEEGCGTDTICEQIIEEYDFKSSKHKAIKRIVQLVIEYCKLNGLDDGSAYDRLVAWVDKIPEDDNAENKLNGSDCESIDSDILAVLKIKD